MRARLTPLFAAGLFGLTLAAAPALAQPSTTPIPPPGTPQPASAPDGGPASPGTTQTVTNGPVGLQGPGIDSAHAVNPAPGAGNQPYVGHSEQSFYDVKDRIDRVEQRVSGLSGPNQRKAMAEIRSIRAELATQQQRHGDVRDWDRENINKRLDAVVARYGLRPLPAEGS